MVKLIRITNGDLGVDPPAGDYEGLGAKPSDAGRFFSIFRKKSYFNAFES